MVAKFKAIWQGLKKKLVSLALCFAIVGGCLGFLWHHYMSANDGDLITQMESKLLDLRYRLRGEIKPTNKISILAIDEKSLQRFGRWPISRKYYEKVFANLKKLGAGWVGFDVVWADAELPLLSDIEPSIKRLKALKGKNIETGLTQELEQINSTLGLSVADSKVVNMIKDYEKIVLGYFYYASKEEAEQLGDKAFLGLEEMQNSALQALILPDGKEVKDYSALASYGIVTNLKAIASAAQNFGFFNNESDADAIMRWVTLVRSIDGQLMPSQSLKLASQIMGREPVIFFDQFGISDISLMNPDDDQDLIKIPVDLNGYGRILINHLGPSKTIKHFSLVDIYDMKLTAQEKKEIKGMNFILGPTAIAINDQRANPFDPGINGVENHAAAVDNILSGRFMRRSADIYVTELLLVLGIGLLFAPIMIYGKAVFSGVAACAFLVAYYYFDKMFWFSKGEWVYMGMPFVEITSLFVGTTLYKYMTEERERKKVKGAFGLYLSADVINQVLDDPEALKLGGQKKELTVFFSDVRGFTTISESLSPERLCELMNDYFTPMTAVIQRSGGVLDKYIGDAIMAFWGAPINLPNHADIAADSAVKMLFELDKLRIDLPKKKLPVVDIGIGLNTGPMSVGNMGSGERFCYTVMGDSVNLGARLEGLTKNYGIKIMVSEFTRKQLTPNSFFLRDLDDIKVKGKTEPVNVFELMRPDYLKSEDALRSLIGEFELGREAYKAQDWEKSKKHFMACMMIKPDDGPTDLYLKRIADAESKPKIEGWNGVYEFKSKTGSDDH
jgi:adenylate cyclase